MRVCTSWEQMGTENQVDNRLTQVYLENGWKVAVKTAYVLNNCII